MRVVRRWIRRPELPWYGMDGWTLSARLHDGAEAAGGTWKRTISRASFLLLLSEGEEREGKEREERSECDIPRWSWGWGTSVSAAGVEFVIGDMMIVVAVVVVVVEGGILAVRLAG